MKNNLKTIGFFGDSFCADNHKNSWCNILSEKLGCTIINFGKPGNGPVIVPGFVLAIEPMITRGSARTKVLADDWTVVSVDKSRGSHFEHTYAVMPDGKPFVLTSFDGGKSELSRLGVEVSELL